ncbi:MAG: hypothetical protein WBA10_17710 [Elainellaceae cyanobacterium]
MTATEAYVSQNRPDVITDKTLKQKRMQAECMHDVSLLLETIFSDQESTVKLILDRLYDIGVDDFIDQKISLRPLNRVTKAIAPRVKPVFRMAGFIWFKKNCPALVTNWLYRKVASGQRLPQLLQDLKEFEEAELEQLAQLSPTTTQQRPALSTVSRPADRMIIDQSNQEICRLRSQVQFLLSALVGTVMLLGSTTLWLMRDSMPLLPSADSSTMTCSRGASCSETAEPSSTVMTTGSPDDSSAAP